jgi:hypothetical protein
MAINRHNYEIYFIDYHEGNLPPDRKEELMAFLIANPDLKKEFDEYSVEPLLADQNIIFRNKKLLKKEESTPEFNEDDQMAIAYQEGDLSADDKLRADSMLDEDDNFQQLHELYLRTRSIADYSITYPDKAVLKKKSNVAFLFPQYLRYAAAAAIVIFIGITAYFRFAPADEPRITSIPQRLETRPSGHIDLQPDYPVLKSRNDVPSSVQMSWREEGIPPVRLASVHPLSVTPSAQDTYAAVILIPRPFPVSGSDVFAMDEEIKKKSLMGKIFSGLFTKASAPFSVENSNRQTTDPGNLSIWDIADLGMKSINVLGDHDYTLVRKYNENGNVKGIMLAGE